MSTTRTEALLAEWAGSEGPVGGAARLVRRLDSGPTNEVSLVEAGGCRYVLRVPSAFCGLPPGIDRSRELAVQCAVAALGHAPAVIAADAGGDFLLSSWVDGRTVAPGELDDATLESVVVALRSIHGLPLEVGAIDYAAHCLAYLREQDVNAQLPATCRALIRDLEASSLRGLCHHDLNPGNMLLTPGGPVFIDWEYAARGCVLLDYAALVAEWQLPAERMCEVAALDCAALAIASAFYAELCRLWHQLFD